MSRMLDALKRRVAETVPPQAEEPPLAVEAPAQPAEEDWWAGETIVPFIEVPFSDSKQATTPLASQSACSATPVISSQAPEKPADSGNLPPDCQFRIAQTDRDIPAPLLPWLSVCRRAGSDLADYLTEKRQTAVILLPMHSVPVDAAAAAIGLILSEKIPGRFLLADTRLGRKELADLFGLVGQPGLSDVIAGLPINLAVQECFQGKFFFLAPGHRLAVPWETVPSRLSRILRNIKKDFALSLFVTESWQPPRLPSPLVHLFPATVLLAAMPDDAAGKTAEAMTLLSGQRVPVLGSLVVPQI